MQRIEGDTNSGRDEFPDLGGFGVEGGGVVLAPFGQLNMITRVEDSADETSLDGRGRHACRHDRRLAEKMRKGGVEMELAVAVSRCQFFLQMRKLQNAYLACTRLRDHFLLHHSSYLTPELNRSTALTARTPRPSEFFVVRGPIPLKTPGPKSIA